MKKIITFLSILIAFVCVISCSSSSTPTAVAEKYVSYLKSGNYDGIADLIYYDQSDSEAAEESKKMIKGILNDKVKSQVDEKGGIKSYEIGEETIDEEGKDATVKVSIVYGNEKKDNMDVDLHCVDGKWYISTGK